MSSKEYATPLRLEIGINRLLRVIFLLFCVLVGAVLLWLPWPLPLSLIVLMLFSGAAANVWCRRAELGGPPVSLVWDGEQRWWWSQAEHTLQLNLLGDSYLSSSLVILNFRQSGARRCYSLLLTSGAVGRETFRRLLVRLRLQRKEALAAGE